MSLALASRCAAISPAWVKNPLWRTARAVPSLDLQFADTKSLADAVTGQSLITFTRASSGTYVGSDGVLRTAANDVPRFNHNPTTGESLGLLAEEQRTNSIRNNTMVGAVAGTPGTLPTNWTESLAGLTRSVVSVGADNGISYIDVRFNGTTTTTELTLQFEDNTSIVSSPSTAWSGSFYVRLIAGSTANITRTSLRMREADAVGTLITATYTDFTATSSALQRKTHTATLGASTVRVNLGLSLGLNSASSVDITLRIGLPQQEQGDFATSVIPTSTAAATRSADVASISGSNFSSWYRQDEGTVFVEGITAPVLSRFPTEWSLHDGTDTNKIDAYNFTTVYGLALRKSGEASTDPTLSLTPVSGVAYKKAAAIKSSDYRVSAQGQQGASANPAFMPATNELRIGAARSGGSALNSTFRRLTYWPARLPNSTLQAITQ